jgi:hypothetical protein
MMQRQAAFAGEMQQRLQDTLVDLQRLQAEQVQQLEWRLEKQLEQVRRSQFERRSRVIRRVFDEYRPWVEDTLSTKPETLSAGARRGVWLSRTSTRSHAMVYGGVRPQPFPRLPSSDDCHRLLRMVELRKDFYHRSVP